MIIKKWNSTSSQWEEQHPKTLETMIYDSTATTTPIFDNGKLKPAYLPDGVFSGMTLVGSISESGSTSPLELKKVISGTVTSGYTISSNLDGFLSKTWPNDYDDIGQRYIGHYWVITSELEVFDATTSTEEADWHTAAFADGVLPATQGTFVDTLNLSAGDWLIITGWDNTNNTFLFNIINNSYRAASTNAKGVVELATDAEVTTGTATNLIPSVKQLKDNYAAKVHTHDDDEITINSAYANIGSSVNDALSDVLTDINTVLGSQASSISTNASDITTLEGRKEVFVQASAPTANQNNDIWFDI